MFFVVEATILEMDIEIDILPTSKSLLLFASWDSLSSYFAGEKKKFEDALLFLLSHRWRDL